MVARSGQRGRLDVGVREREVAQGGLQALAPEEGNLEEWGLSVSQDGEDQVRSRF